MATTQSVCYVKGVTPTSVHFPFTHQASTEGVAAGMDIMEQTTTVQVQLPCAFPVGSKFRPQQVITRRGSVGGRGKKSFIIYDTERYKSTIDKLLVELSGG